MADEDELTKQAQPEPDTEIQGAPALPRAASKTEQADDKDAPDAEAAPTQDTSEETDTEALDDERTDEAVDDIVRKESDELLAVQDRRAASEPADQPKKRHWWQRKWLAWLLVLLLFAGGMTAALIPISRYFLLNTAGVRVRASVHVADSTTGQPLKNVTVTIGGASAETDEQGNAALAKLKLGPQKLTIKRVAFATYEKEIILGWGSNPLGTVKLSPSGAQYTFYVRDFLSKKPLEGAEITSGRLSAVADKDGKAVLTTQNTDRGTIPVTVTADGYRTDEKAIPVDTSDKVELLMVPSNKVVFVAKAAGRYNVYSMYADGKDRKVLLGGTGRETSDIALAVSPNGQAAALVSVRENITAEKGEFLQSLTVINVSDGSVKVVDRALDIALIDWIGDKLVYQMTMPGKDSSDTQRQRLVSYGFDDDKRIQLATAATFKSVASAQGQVYYSAGDTLNKVSAVGGTKAETVLDKAVTAAYRTDYDTLTLRTSDGWRTLSLSSDATATISAPAAPKHRVYVANGSGDQSLWVDGGTLKVYGVSSGEDTRVLAQSGLAYPVRWLSDTIAIYRAGGTDYAVSTNGGDPRKLATVTPTSGLIQAY